MFSFPLDLSGAAEITPCGSCMRRSCRVPCLHSAPEWKRKCPEGTNVCYNSSREVLSRFCCSCGEALPSFFSAVRFASSCSRWLGSWGAWLLLCLLPLPTTALVAQSFHLPCWFGAALPCCDVTEHKRLVCSIATSVWKERYRTSIGKMLLPDVVGGSPPLSA